jgi:protein Mpv17
MFRIYQKWLAERPLLTKTWTSGLLFGTGDLICQGIMYKNQDDDAVVDDQQFWRDYWQARRTLNMTLVGVAIAPYLHGWYGLVERMFPALSPSALAALSPAAAKRAVWAPVIKKTLADQVVNAPIITGMFFTLIGALEGQSRDEIFDTMRHSYMKTLMLNWAFWPAAMTVNFRYLAPQYRVLGANVTGLAWNTILSAIRYEAH